MQGAATHPFFYLGESVIDEGEMAFKALPRLDGCVPMLVGWDESDVPWWGQEDAGSILPACARSIFLSVDQGVQKCQRNVCSFSEAVTGNH